MRGILTKHNQRIAELDKKVLEHMKKIWGAENYPDNLDISNLGDN